jgi:cytochrome c-type biogenesis protein CcmF
MSLATQDVVLMHPGETKQSAGYSWTLESLRNQTGPNYAERVATMRLERNGRLIAVMQPSRRTFPVQRMTTTEAAIHTNGVADLYVVLGEERDDAAIMRLNYNPLAPWIWFGALIMAAGGGLSLLDRRTRVGAPARARKDKVVRPGSAVA